MDVRMELSRILISELGEQQVIFLREKGGERTFPIMIGINEALAVRRRLHGRQTPRPLTHELLSNVIDAMGGRLEKIVIDNLSDHTFFAKLHIRRGNELIAVDSRPSDAIALGAAFDTPIYVNEEVINKILNGPDTAAERIELLRQRLEMLCERMAELTEQLDDDDFIDQAPDAMVQQARRQLIDMQHEHDAIRDVLDKLK